MASFPNAIKAFTTKSAGQTIQSATTNDIQDEITAIETALLTGPFALSNSTSGFWTPINGSSAVFNLTTNAAAVFVKSGPLMLAAFDVSYPVTADGAAALIAGLPFPTLGGAAPGAGIIGIGTEATLKQLSAGSGASVITLRDQSGANVTNATMSGDRIAATIMYRANV